MSIILRDGKDTIQAVKTGLDSGNSTVSLASTATSFTPNSKLIALSSPVAYYINVGGTADTSDFYIPADTLWYNFVDGQSVSVIATATGTLYVSEVV